MDRGPLVIGTATPSLWMKSAVRLMHLRVYDRRDTSHQPAPSPSLCYLLTQVHNTLPTSTLLTITCTQVLWFLEPLPPQKRPIPTIRPPETTSTKPKSAGMPDRTPNASQIWQTPPEAPPRGIRNAGHSCAAIVALQLCLHIEPLAHILQDPLPHPKSTGSRCRLRVGFPHVPSS